MPALAAFIGFVRRPPLARLERREDYRWWVVATVCIGAFLGQLDASIASLALPTLEQEFHVPVSAVEWVSIAYLVTLASLVVVFGRAVRASSSRR